MNEIEPLQTEQEQLLADMRLEPSDLDGLAAYEVVELYSWTLADRAHTHEKLRHDTGAALDTLLESIVTRNLDRAKEIFTAFADSPYEDLRLWIADSSHWLTPLTVADHDSGLAIWDKLVRDEDNYVRGRAMSMLEETIEEALANGVRGLARETRIEGFRLIPLLDEEALNAESGLTRADVYSLFESYAYAENGTHVFDLAWTALEKVLAAKKQRISSGD